MTTPEGNYIEGKDYEYDGLWNFNVQWLPEYTDLLFGGSFTVDKSKGQTLESQLEETRKKFKVSK